MQHKVFGRVSVAPSWYDVLYVVASWGLGMKAHLCKNAARTCKRLTRRPAGRRAGGSDAAFGSYTVGSAESRIMTAPLLPGTGQS